MLRMPVSFVRLVVIAWLIWGVWIVGGRSPSAYSLSDEQVRVAAAQSGQALEVSSLTSPLAESVRLLGVNAPDGRQDPWGSEATRHLDQWLKGRTVRLEFDQSPRDAYGRKVAYVWLGDQLINERLVAEGWALAQGAMAFAAPDRSTRYDQRLMAAQEQARLLGRGVWDPVRPMRQTPGEFRQQED